MNDLKRSGDIKWGHLFDVLRKSGVDLDKYLTRHPNAKRLSQALEMERSINFPAANAERDRIIDELAPMMERADLERLVLAAIEFKMNKITPAAFHAVLLSYSDIYQVTNRYRNLVDFAKYTDIMESLDLKRVLPELEMLCNEVVRDLEKPRSTWWPRWLGGN